MFKRLNRIAFSIAFCLVCLPLVAADAVDPAVSKTIIDRLSAARPELSFTTVEASPVAGIYQVKVEQGPLLYVTADGNHFFVGDLYEVQEGRFVNLAEQAFAELRRLAVKELKQEDMIVFSPKGETKAVINVFTDVDCGYCRKLHREMAAYNDLGIEVRYLAFPRAGLDSNSYRKVATAWCAESDEEKRNILTRLKNGGKVEESVCEDNPVAAQYHLGQEMGVNGTPAILLMDGTLIPGYQPAPALAKMLGIN